MAVLPRGGGEMIDWFAQRIDTWQDDPAAIGLTPDQTTELAARTAAARGLLEAAQLARIESKSATVASAAGEAALRSYGADMIRIIKAFAETAEDRAAVYVRANVPPPAPRTPQGPPGQPHGVQVRLGSRGELHLAWKAEDAAASSGVYFVVSRRLDNDPVFTLLGATGEKAITDDTLPRGTGCATYVIAPFRGTLAGPVSVQTRVQFGTDHAPDSRAATLAANPNPGSTHTARGGAGVAA